MRVHEITLNRVWGRPQTTSEDGIGCVKSFRGWTPPLGWVDNSLGPCKIARGR